MKSVRSAVRIGSHVWAATSGGVFVYDTTMTSYTKYTNVDGLSSNDLYTIGTDIAGRIWVGASNGSINVYDQTSQKWLAISDIYENGTYTTKTVHQFLSKGDSMLVVSDFGVSIFRLSKWEFGDTYSNFAFASTPSVSCAALQGNRLWVGTSLGVTVGVLGSSSTVLWNSVYTTLGSLGTTVVSAMAIFHDTLIVGTSAGAVFFDAATNTFQPISALAGKNIVDFQCDTLHNRLLVLLAGDGLKVLSSIDGSTMSLYLPYTSAVSAFTQNDFSRLASSGNGIVEWNNGTWNARVPNGPYSTNFSSVIVDNKGVLWCAGGEVSLSGFYRYNPALMDMLQWKNFNSDNSIWMHDHSGNASNGCHKVSQGLNGSVWVSTWGNGFYVVENDSVVNRIDHYTVKPGLSVAEAKDIDFVVGSGTAIDASGQLWLALYNTYNGNSLTKLMSDSTDSLYANNTSNYGGFVDITIDQYDTKWFSCALPEHT
ncbi:MAG TPA: hypothetical protein VMU30_12625, partial [Bacteroidota bacterium]|nr:hypothetical protein [Bacteroidota bacterium]